MPHTTLGLRIERESDTVGIALMDGLMSYQLVGEVMAHQGFDG